MARTGRGENAKHSDMPAMTSGLHEQPTFDYLDLLDRHRWDRPKLGGSQVVGGERSLVPSFIHVASGVTEPAACWNCPGCGKTLVSAVHKFWQPPVGMYCTRKCREAHT